VTHPVPGPRDALGWVWQHFLPRARIGVRIVTAVATAMALVLLAAGAFVFWRVSYALDRQLDQDLRAYADVVTRAVRAGGRLPADNPGEVSQTYTTSGRLLAKSDRGVRRLLAATAVRAATGTPRQVELGRFLPAPDRTPYRLRYQQVATPDGPVVLVAGISRHKHDEALRELLGQLAIADLATILAAAAVGWGVTRAALGPVERYRRAAAAAGGNPSARLPIDATREDELTRLGMTLNGLLAAIEAGQRRERQFLADASHELRSPLALMSAEVEWARHRPRTSAELDRVLASLGEEVARLASLADALLDLEEVSDSSSTRREPVDLAELVGRAVAAQRKTADQLGRTIVVHATSGTIEVEPHWVELAVDNLVGNALKHGSGTVTVTAGFDGDVAVIEVGDEGVGIPAALGTAAFERFARADASRTTPGHGLGLAIVAAVAHRHGGSASLDGGRVRLTLAASE
jgi:signal transduction histidine kinase